MPERFMIAIKRLPLLPVAGSVALVVAGIAREVADRRAIRLHRQACAQRAAVRALDGRAGHVPLDRPAAAPQRTPRARAMLPWQIPLAGWKAILLRTYRQSGEDRLLAVAAGVVFLGLVALFPAITALVSLYGLFAKVSTVSQHLSHAADVLPAAAIDIIGEQIARLTAKGEAKLSLAFAFGLALALWSANAGMKAIIDALNVAYGEKERRGFLHLNALSLSFTVAAIAGVLVAMGAIVVVPLIFAMVGFATAGATFLSALRWPLLFVMVAGSLALLYRFGPSHARPQWRLLAVGSIAAALLWLAGSGLFSWYLANFAHYDATYGSLGAAIGLMMWMWISAIVVLLGAELNSEIEHELALARNG
jgi:membrane protein